MKKIKREILKGFFVLEGIDGAGTTTQLRKCEQRAIQEGLPIRADFEPTSHPIGQLIRKILKSEIAAEKSSLSPLFVADRNEHVEGQHGIRSALKSGSKVICDRYLFSSLAYQTQFESWERIWGLNAQFPFPEAVFYLDVHVHVAQSRIDGRGEAREIFEDRSLQEKIRLSYERAFDQAQEEGLELVRLDATLPIDRLFDLIWERICR